MSIFSTVESDFDAAIHKVRDFVGHEASVFEVALVTEVKKEFALLSPQLWAEIKNLFGQAASAVEQIATEAVSGDIKWSSAMSLATGAIEKIGISPAIFSQTTKDSLLQAASAVVKAGMGAVAGDAMKAAALSVLGPTQSQPKSSAASSSTSSSMKSASTK